MRVMIGCGGESRPHGTRTGGTAVVVVLWVRVVVVASEATLFVNDQLSDVVTAPVATPRDQRPLQVKWLGLMESKMPRQPSVDSHKFRQ